MKLCCKGDDSDYKIVELELKWGNGNSFMCIQLKLFVMKFVERVNKETNWDIKSIVVVGEYKS